VRQLRQSLRRLVESRRKRLDDAPRRVCQAIVIADAGLEFVDLPRATRDNFL
jgi:hypothetical protein